MLVVLGSELLQQIEKKILKNGKKNGGIGGC